LLEAEVIDTQANKHVCAGIDKETIKKYCMHSKIMSLAKLFFITVFILIFFAINSYGSDESSPENSSVDPFLIRTLKNEGINVSSKDKISFKITGKLRLDTGNINADNVIDKAFPNLQENSIDFRQLSVVGLGTLKDWAIYKLEIDFANVREIKDNWILFNKVPYVGHIKTGHMKEPFSLARLTSSEAISFMERSLPTFAFSPGRNLGISGQSEMMDGRMTCNAGVFWITASLSDFGDAPDQFSRALGLSLTGRISGLPLYENDGSKLIHMGFSYSHQFRNADKNNPGSRFSTLPECYLAEDRLVDTGFFLANNVDLLNTEFAFVSGRYSCQAEYYHAFIESEDVGNPDFWGAYIYNTFFITDDQGKYHKASGVFARIEPKTTFRPRHGGWGAWEVGCRLSCLDLNDNHIKGGEETNITLGINWYLNNRSRFMFNYIHAYVDNRSEPPINEGNVDIFQMRFQISI